MVNKVRWNNSKRVKGPHFHVRNEACRVSDKGKDEHEFGIVSSHNIDHHWLFFSHHSGNYQIFMSNFKIAVIKKKDSFTSKPCDDFLWVNI